MSKNLPKLASAHEAAQGLHKTLLGAKWYIRTQVFSTAPPPGEKHGGSEIIVYVKHKDNLSAPTSYSGWPIRYELGAH